MTSHLGLRRAARIFSLFLLLFMTAAGAEAAERSGFFFDTTVDIRVNAKNGEALLDRCFDLCRRLELVFSAEDEDSELYAVNHRTSRTLTVSDDLRDCLAAALKYCELTDGRFDITIYPVSSLWDFHAESPSVPDAEEIASALEKVDYWKVHLEGNELTFDSDDTMIDLGGIAKGYISAALCRLLREEGCTSALVNLGGNVSALGFKKGKKPWKVGIQKPFAGRGELLTVVDAADCCVITSGTYERYFEQDGVSYHHIIDPRTGYPSETDVTQVTLIGTDDAACDALATCVILTGTEEAGPLLEAAGVEAELYYVGGDGVLRDAGGNPA